MIIKSALFRCFYSILYFLLPLPLIILIWNSDPVKYDSFRLTPMVFGVIAYTMLNVQLILASRPRWLEKWFGMDHLYRIHGFMAVAAIAAALLHRSLEPRLRFIPLLSPSGSAALDLFLIASVLAVLFMTPLLKNLPLPAVLLSLIDRCFLFRYHIQRNLHNITVAAAAIMFIHVMLTPAAGNPSVRNLYILYWAAAMCFYLWHRCIRPCFFRRIFTVRSVVPESDTMTTLNLCPLKSTVRPYRAGQFAYFSFRDAAVSKEEHPFSITSSPTDRAHLSLTVKDLGDWTSGVRNISEGSIVKVDGPYGRLSPVLYPVKNGIILIAAGAGITPMLSIIRYYRHKDPDPKILLFWMASHEKDLIRKKEWEQLTSAMKNLTCVPIVSRDPDFQGEKGHLSHDILQKYLSASRTDISCAQIFICGPAGMQKTCLRILHDFPVEQQNIHTENFSF